MIAGGVASASAIGFGVGKIAKSAENLSKRTFDYITEKSDELPKNVKSPALGLAKAKRRLQIAKRFSSAGTFLSGALLSRGIKQKLKEEGFKEDSIELSLGIEAGSHIATQIVAKAAQKSFGIKTSFKLPSTVKTVAFSILKKRLKI